MLMDEKIMSTDNKHNCIMEESIQEDLNDAKVELPKVMAAKSHFAKMAIKDEELPLLVLKKVVYMSSRKKRKNMWTSDIIQKKARKGGDWSSKLDETEREKDDEEFKLSDSIEHDKNYFFVHLAEIYCKLCSFKGKLIVQHYRMSHPESEVLISRLNPRIAEILIEDALRNHEEYEKNHSELDKMTCSFKCPFCLMLIKNTTNMYYNHISSHTGEYCFHCNHCSYWTYNHMNIHSHLNQMHHKFQKTEYKMVFLDPKVSKYVFGYICSECNFIQLIRMTVEEHAMVYHPGMPKIHKVNLGVLLHDNVLSENLMNKIHSNFKQKFVSGASDTHNHNVKIPVKTEELSDFLVQTEELEKVKVKIEPDKLDSDMLPIEPTVFECGMNLDIEVNTPISDQLQINLVTEIVKESEKIKRENKEPKNMSEEMEKLDEEVDSPEQPDKAKKSVEVLKIGPISIIKEFNVFTFHCKIKDCNYSSEDKKAFAIHCEIVHKDVFYNFGSGKCNICSIKFEYTAKFVTVYDVYLHIVTMHKDIFTEDKEEAFDSEVKLPVITSVQSVISKTEQLVSASEDDAEYVSVLTDIPMTDTEKQNRKCPKAAAIMMKPPLLEALYKCPKYDCSFTTTLPLSFQKHFATHHSILMDTLVPCLYCDYKVSCSSYVIHLEVRHGHCLFGCSDCFYRTTNSYFITMHRELMHPNTEFNILQLQVVTSGRISADTTPANLSELVPPYNCKEDGFLNCLFKTLYFDEYLKHVEAIHQVDGLGSFSFEQKPQKDAVMEGWLAKEVGPFQCRYCKKATVTHEEMGRHQAVYHTQEECLFYYRKFVPNDTVVIPEQINLEDPSFINHVIHLPNQIHLCDFKLTDGLLSSTSAKLTIEKSEVPLRVLPLAENIDTDSGQSSISLRDEPEAFSRVVKEEECLFEEPNSVYLNKQPKDGSAHNNVTVTPSKLQCKWKDCYQTLCSQTALIKHIEKNHLELQNGKEFTCFWNNCPRKCISFTMKHNLLRHMKGHTGQRLHKCSFQDCNKAFSRLGGLNIHQRIHTGDRPYLCQFPNCSESFFTGSSRNDHERLHYDPEAYACQVTNCPKKYKEPAGLRQHMPYHTVEEQHEAKRKSVEKKQKVDDFVLTMRKSSNTLQCKWDGCFQTQDSQMMLVKHIETYHIQMISRSEEYTCFWINCPRKSKPFPTRQRLSRHMRIHSGEKPYKCSSCNKPFSQLENLKAHQMRHTGERPYLCQFPSCFKSFIDSSAAAEHQKLHYNTCKWKDCYQTVSSQTALIKHIQKNHVQSQSGKEFTCIWNNCPRKSKPFGTRQDLLVHMRVHTGERPHKCSFQGCNKTFSRLRNLKAHQGSHTGERPYLCQFSNCSKSFLTSCSRKNHQRQHHNGEAYACQVTDCPKKCKNSSDLPLYMKNHTSEEHLEAKPKSVEKKQKADDFVLKKSLKTLQCKWDGCFQIHHSQTALVKHIEMSHVQIKNPSEGYACFWINCKRKAKPLASKQGLLIHMRGHSREKAYKCSSCNTAFSQLERLKIHQRRRHTGERPYLCQFPNCFKSFVHSSDAAEHQKLHYDTCKWKDCYQTLCSQTALIKHIQKNHVQLQSGKEFTCFWNNCPRKLKPYYGRSRLLKHMMVHTGETPHKCSFQGCNKTFSRLRNLKAHQRRHTGEMPYLCQFSNCSKRFFSACGRKNHQKQHHNRKAYGCKVTDCPKKCENPSGLPLYMKNHTIEEQLEAKQKSLEKKQKADDFVVKKSLKTLQCKWEGCDQETCDSQTDLVKHIGKNHVQLQKGRNRFTCFWINCPRKSKPFTTRQSLLVHMRVHTGERPYKCTFQGCNKTFSQLGVLKGHEWNHTGERPYFCQFANCFRSFCTIDDRDYHQAVHYNTIYACQVTGCSEKYADPSSLQKHIENHTHDDKLEVKQKSVENELKENDFIIYHL